jgi:rhamnose transport system permease protein
MSETATPGNTPAAAPVADSTKPLATEPKGRTGAARILASRDAVTIYALLAFLVFAAISIPRFASPVTTGFLLLDVIPVLLIAMPMTLIIVTGEIDLSVASTAGLTSALMGVLWAGGMDIWLVLAISLLAGVAAGMFNGFLIAVLGLPSLAVTIGTLALFRGLALVVIGVVLIVLFFGILLHFTPFGRGLYAMGYSKEAANFVGIKVARSKFWLYAASGAVSALAGIYWTLRYTSARSDNASGLELAVIAAVLLGGVSIFGGKGTIPGAVAGVLLIGSLNYALRLGRVSDVVLITVTGLLLIFSVVAPSIGSAVREWRHLRRVRQSFSRGTSARASTDRAR